jgi:hypothetical protein
MSIWAFINNSKRTNGEKAYKRVLFVLKFRVLRILKINIMEPTSIMRYKNFKPTILGPKILLFIKNNSWARGG